MTGSRILWGQMLGALFAVLAGLWGATEWTAWRLGFAPALGLPWLQVRGIPIYSPHAFFPWWLRYDRYAPRVFAIGALIATLGGIGAMLIALLGSLLRARQAATVTTYGSARWAVRDDLRHAGLFDPAGVPLGRSGREILRHEGPEHVLAFAPTRSGKGVGLVVPTLLSWCESVIVHDIKGENWTLRYYDDRAFAGRVQPPPVLSEIGYADRPPGLRDDWTGLAPVAPPADGTGNTAASPPGGNGGLRQEPELPEHEAVTPRPEPANEFAFVEDEPDDDAQRARFARQTTRTAAMDRDDGLGMEMTP